MAINRGRIHFRYERGGPLCSSITGETVTAAGVVTCKSCLRVLGVLATERATEHAERRNALRKAGVSTVGLDFDGIKWVATVLSNENAEAAKASAARWRDRWES